MSTAKEIREQLAKQKRVQAVLERSQKNAYKERHMEKKGVSVLGGYATPQKSYKEEQKELAFRKMGLTATEHNENDADQYDKNAVNFAHAIPSNSKVIVTRMNHLIEIQHMKTMNFKQTIQMLPRNEDTGFREYEVISTGEVFNMNESENRSESKNSLQKTFKKLRYLINNNFTGGGNELHVTLTFRDNITDTKDVYMIFEKFMKRLKYSRKKLNQKVEYINVIEPHASGKWHCHLLLSFTQKEGDIYVPLEKDIYISNDEMAKIWGQGFVTIKKLKHVDNIGAYLSAYLADVDVTGTGYEGENVVTRKVDGKEKKFLKGGRLHFYESGANIYRSSSGIKEPLRENMKYADIKKEVGQLQPHFSKRINIEQENYENQITYLQYNLKRK